MNTSVEEDSDDIDDIDLITALINEHPELFIDVKEKKKRRRREVIPFQESPWGRLLASPGIKNAISYHVRLFRTRFRVPYVLFRDLLVVIRHWELGFWVIHELIVDVNRGHSIIPLLSHVVSLFGMERYVSVVARVVEM